MEKPPFINPPSSAWLLCDWHVLYTRKEKCHWRVTSSALLFTRLLSLLLCTRELRQVGEKKKTLWTGRLSLPSSCYPFVCLPFLKSLRNSHPPLSHVCCTFFHLAASKRQNRKWLSLPGNIGLWVQCKLIWKADAHTSCFTHKNTNLITVTPAEPGAANLVWRLSTLLMSRHILVFFFFSFFLLFWVLCNLNQRGKKQEIKCFTETPRSPFRKSLKGPVVYIFFFF